jgi:hypothetical protein
MSTLLECKWHRQCESLLDSNNDITKTVIAQALPTKENRNTLTKINVTGIAAEMGHVTEHHNTFSKICFFYYVSSAMVVLISYVL